MSFTSDKGVDPSAPAWEHASEKAVKPFKTLGCVFAAAMEWMHSRRLRHELAAPPESNFAETQACAKFVLTRYNIRAAAFCRLISTAESRNAFLVLLDCFVQVAWYEFAEIGGPQELPPGALSITTGIERRKRWWTRQAYTRIARSGATGAQNEDGETPSSLEHRSNASLISGRSAALDFIPDLSTSLNRISADNPNCGIWKAFCLKNHDAQARSVVYFALQASHKKPPDPEEAMRFALSIFDNAATAQIALVSDLESAAGCETELRKLVGGCLDYMEAFLTQTGRCRVAAKWRSKLERELVRRFARGKRRALKAAKQAATETIEQETVPRGSKRHERRFSQAHLAARERRYKILKRFRIDKGISTMHDLARHFGMSVTAIEGIVRGDATRYGQQKQADFLKKIGVNLEDW
jgi:hypothetical protein